MYSSREEIEKNDPHQRKYNHDDCSLLHFSHFNLFEILYNLIYKLFLVMSQGKELTFVQNLFLPFFPRFKKFRILGGFFINAVMG